MARSNEPLWWGPFMAGAGAAALVLPALILITSTGSRWGWVTDLRLYDVLESRVARVALFVVISLSFFHAAHRLRFVLVDLGLKQAKNVVAVVCYGCAIVGTLLTAAAALRLM